MRADRLVAVLLLLQRRGRVTAAEVAAELEVSERTARRDLEALGMAGLPVYSQRGRHGGWSLAGGGRTDLSGLSAREVRALFLLVGPSSQATPEVRAALRKLTRAIPEPLRATAESARAAVVVDSAGWDRPSAAPRPEPPWLGACQQAVVDAEQVELTYVSGSGAATERVVHPLGLANKGAAWYLLADTDDGRRTFRVDRVRAVRPTGAPALRPEGFDLAQEWRTAVGAIDDLRTPLRARAEVDPGVVGVLRFVLGTRVAVGPPGPDGWVEVELRGHGVDSLAGEIAGFGARVRVQSPDELRARLGELGRELAAFYDTR